MLDLENPSRAAELALPEWCEAEFFDTPLSGDVKLRALVCRLAVGKWQWSVCSLEGDRGELISIGVADNAAAARATALSEITKCMENPLG
ncbi:MAG TPA: hypothetical protein VM782_09480 [Stellaceae bacterium]|nr:hypothetical protein [Stellaceae bacterium]